MHGPQRQCTVSHRGGGTRGGSAHADGLARVVDDGVQVRVAAVQRAAEGLQARQVAQVHAVHVEAVDPLRGVRLAGVARGGVVREPGGDDERGARAQQLEADLVACAGERRVSGMAEGGGWRGSPLRTDLDAAAGQQHHLAAHVRPLVPLLVVEAGAAWEAHTTGSAQRAGRQQALSRSHALGQSWS